MEAPSANPAAADSDVIAFALPGGVLVVKSVPSPVPALPGRERSWDVYGADGKDWRTSPPGEFSTFFATLSPDGERVLSEVMI